MGGGGNGKMKWGSAEFSLPDSSIPNPEKSDRLEVEKKISPT